MNLLCPSACVHCKQEAEAPLCNACFQELELLDPEGRCVKCFHEINQLQGVCPTCRQKSSPIRRLAACFEGLGAAGSFLAEYKTYGRIELARDIAAFMVLQLERLHWPTPDILVPIPLHWTRRFIRGFNQSEEIAKALSSMLSIPMQRLLKRQSSGFSSSQLSHEQRQALPKDIFTWRQEVAIEEKNILLLDDAIVTGTTLRCGADTLQEGSPRAVYALTFTI